MANDIDRDTGAMEASPLIEQAARVCHETVRAYCVTLGDDSIPPWDEASEDQRESSISGVKAYFEQYAAAMEPTARSTHETWLMAKRAAGWKYGAIKNDEAKEHPSLVPYEQLSPEERRKDYLFTAVCKAFCATGDEEKNVRAHQR